MALSFLAPWRDDDFKHGSVNGQKYMREMYPGAFDKFRGASGSLYSVEDDGGWSRDTRLTHSERIRRSPARVLQEEKIKDVFEALKLTQFLLLQHGETHPLIDGPWEKEADLTMAPELVAPPELPLSDQLYQAWKANPTPELMGPLITSMRPLMESQLGKYKGTLPPSALRGQAKRFMAGAVKSYDPTRGTKLTSHVVNSLQQLHRKNYEAQSAFRLSEELQRGIGIYHRSMENLRAELGREPTLEEISGDLAWPMSKIQRLARQDRGEVSGEDLSYDPIDPYQDSHDPVIDFVYHDLSPEDKIVMELATGYGGKAKLPKTEIARILKVTPARVTQRSLEIAKKIKEATDA
jgi:DNA-directed RNA polymerase specialized sigma subunit